MAYRKFCKYSLASAVSLVAIATVPASAWGQETTQFNIESQLLSKALLDFNEQTGITVAASRDLTEGKRSSVVRGEMKPEEALRLMLADTGLTYRQDSSGAVIVQRVAEEGSAAVAQGESNAPAQGTEAAEPDTENAAEEDEAEARLGEVIVTARKKGESDLDVPIAIQAMPSAELEARGVQSLTDLAAVTPSLLISESFGSLGGTMNLRGVGASSLNAATDQAVALNLDGVTVANGTAARFAQFDMARVEVLQGPQALYFGKNTTAGIVSVVSADPTDELYTMLRAGYEFEADEILTEAVISGPITDSLSGRVALYRSEQEGYFDNPLASTNVQPPADLVALYGPLDPPRYSRGPNTTDLGIRGTLLYEPTDRFSLRLKGTYFDQEGSASNANTQLYFCPAGVPAPGIPGNIPGVGECDVDETLAPLGQNPTAEVGGDPTYRDGQPYQEIYQYLLSADAEYRLTDNLTLNSTTGYYKVDMLDAANATWSPYPALGSVNQVKRDDFTQELRLTSDFNSPINWMIGAYYQTGDFSSDGLITILQDVAPNSIYYIDSRTWGGFGEVTFEFGDFVLAAGGRYTDEKKDLDLYSKALGGFATDLPVTTVHSKNFSPEVSLTWNVADRTNLFVSYRKGTKSGGFNADTLNLPPYADDDISYDDETVEGFEGGVKSVLLNGALRADLTGYTYEYRDLQVGVLDPVAVTQLTRNAATADVRGIQFNANYQPPSIEGFRLSGALNYSNARFSDYIGTCYAGQSIAAGCNLDIFGNPVEPGEVAVNQDFDGKPLVKAPDWTGSLSATYDFPVTSNGTYLGLNVAANYSSKYHTVDTQPVNSLQDAYTTFDAQVRLFNDRGGWELALIGKNLTDELRIQQGVEVPFSPGPGVNAGTGTNGPTVPADLAGFTNAPFQLMVRLTIRPHEFFNQ
ncbi:TonB-dependent receptor domain-containing protein [Henriciella aquimarina]|uniref:TonB-dependent receptor domain-containing protein n=1 Tax=Henriciella aquimarina TaxID=545261 RepID=UPI0009FC5FCC|nr:TonB-dependent receptor [Henriciella aquimarina]